MCCMCPCRMCHCAVLRSQRLKSTEYEPTDVWERPEQQRKPRAQARSGRRHCRFLGLMTRAPPPVLAICSSPETNGLPAARPQCRSRWRVKSVCQRSCQRVSVQCSMQHVLEAAAIRSVRWECGGAEASDNEGLVGGTVHWYGTIAGAGSDHTAASCGTF